MEICKTPAPWFKVLNKCNIMLIVYMEMENVSHSLTKANT